MKTTEENNLMICKFLGIRPEYELSDPLFNSTYSFHTSWNWLIPALNKVYQNKHVVSAFKIAPVMHNIKEAIFNNEVSVAHYFVCVAIELINEQK
jgi:hypothetical protein